MKPTGSKDNFEHWVEKRPISGKTGKARAAQPGAQEFFDNLITMDLLIELLGGRYSRSTINRWRRKGMPSVRIENGRVWFPKDQVLLWLERRIK